MKIILASESLFRRRAMDLLGIAYEVQPANLDEKAIRDEDPEQLTAKLAQAKAATVARSFPDAIIVSGDAVAAKGGRIFEKPESQAEAAEFLREFSGSAFDFVTSLVVLNAATEKMLSAVERLTIHFRPLLEREIQRYIQNYEVTRYAGAFENDAVAMFSDHITGSYNIGTALPPSRLILMLRDQGVDL